MSHKTRVFRYIVSGGVAAAVDFSLLYTMVHWLGIWYLVSATVAFIATVCTSFVMQKYWTFRDSSPEAVHVQMFAYLVLSLINIGVNTVLMYVLVDFLTINYIMAQVYSTIVIAFYGFFVYRYLIFRALP